MSYLKEKVSYLKGLAEGMELDGSTDEKKLLKAILDVLDDFALVIDDMDEAQESLGEQVDEIEESVARLEQDIYNDDFDECISVTCPNCGEIISLDEEEIDNCKDKIVCPNCNKEVDVDWECDCCGHGGEN